MPYPQLDRHTLRIKPLSARKDKVYIEKDHVPPTAKPRPFNEQGKDIIAETVARILQAKRHNLPRMLTFGAHTIKNGLGLVLIKLIEEGWVTHLATNGAGIIHDWEFAFQGHSSEDVRGNTSRGEFGAWEETGFYINLAINVGAYQGLGYGESIGAFVEQEGLKIPEEDVLRERIQHSMTALDYEKAAAAADLLNAVHTFRLRHGWMTVKHPYKQYGIQAAAYRLKVPFTSHPMFGHDIIYVHPMNMGAAVGRTAQRDFLAFAHQVSRIDGGVYMSIGSAVMSPMVFEKSMSMAQNLAIQRGGHLDKHFMVIVDLQESHWDWRQGEPPENNPDYYLRYNKSFNRMGGEMRYLTADNRDFLLTLLQMLRKAES
ncbi:MAG: hypothetical protein HYV26_16085 [Candidatus Hydrogenedentes bacterium]|nr:hypothetical protein [Candidatus Hydrogenedentota bacterium]MBI3118356.1 hypothetical protein [Candidatus Hydrogenedentota bacterium]